MIRVWAVVAIAGLVSGCATRYDSPSRFVGKPVSDVIQTMPKYGGMDLVDDKGRHFYRWNFDAVEKVSIQESYAYYNTDRPGMTTGLSFRDEMRQQRCSVTAYYDPVTRITTDFKVRRSGGAKCHRMSSYLDGSAFKPTNFPGSN
jgi:hypothetical protein